jgi:hypothetical protein
MTAPAMRLRLPMVRRYVQSIPWAIMPERGAALLEILGVHVAGKSFTAEQIKARVGDRPAPIAGRQGAVQVISVFGVVAHRMDMLSEMSGGCSTLRVADDFDAAMNDPNVTAIVLQRRFAGRIDRRRAGAREADPRSAREGQEARRGGEYAHGLRGVLDWLPVR